MDSSRVIELIRNNNIAIYGNGYVAEQFYLILRMHNLEKNIQFYIITDEEKAHGTMHGIPVRYVKNIVNEKEILICIAVHEVVKDDIEATLSELNVNNYIWVYPYMTVLALGEPIDRHKKISVCKIMRTNLVDSYVMTAMAVRYLAIDNYYKKNEIGYDVYVKVFSMHCEAKTARKRLKGFIGLIEDWDKNGYRKDSNILIDENCRILDGIHRFTLACYHRMEYICCDIYPYLHDYNKKLNENGLCMDKLKHSELGVSEINALDQEIVKIKEAWN